MFKEGPINDVRQGDLTVYKDERGWLSELMRCDELEGIFYPAMSYISMTLPNQIRGPHAHTEQTDYFCFPGPSTFKLILWDNRKDSPTYQNKVVLFVGEDNPKIVIVPPGVVHGYKNVGQRPGIVVNFPNHLYMGWKRKGAVDEIRYEDDPKFPFVMED